MRAADDLGSGGVAAAALFEPSLGGWIVRIYPGGSMCHAAVDPAVPRLATGGVSPDGRWVLLPGSRKKHSFVASPTWLAMPTGSISSLRSTACSSVTRPGLAEYRQLSQSAAGSGPSLPRCRAAGWSPRSPARLQADERIGRPATGPPALPEIAGHPDAVRIHHRAPIDLRERSGEKPSAAAATVQEARGLPVRASSDVSPG